MVLFVEECNLVLELDHDLFISFLMELQVELFQILTTLVQPTQTNNLIVASFDPSLQLLAFFFEPDVRLHQSFVLNSNLVLTFI